MAELVHLRLEHGLKELEEMERTKLFNRDEIRKISKKRKLYEYRLRRRMKSKEDFLQYIEYEICLLLLISKRRQRLLVESKKKEIDNSIAKKINRLFKAVISRYPDDEKLWLNQIEYFKRMKWNDSINALFTKVLQIHSRKPNIWIMAAKWEMEENNSFDNSRGLFQRGVLLNPKSEILWREYYRMELKYLQMIRKRKEVLKLHDIKDSSKENDLILKGAIPQVVFEKAVEEIPDIEFALSFINICSEFDFSVKEAHNIIANVQKRFPDSEEIMDASAKLPLLQVKERAELWSANTRQEPCLSDIKKTIFQEICANYEKAILLFKSEKMWTFYLDFLFGKLELCNSPASKAKIESLIIEKMEKASGLNCLAMEFCIKWIELLLKRREDEKAIDVSITQAYKWNTVPLWIECISAHLKCGKSKEAIYNLINEAISLLKEQSTIQIWKVGIEFLTVGDPEKLLEFFEKGITEDKKISLPLKEMYLETVALRDGIEAARNLYQRFETMGPLSRDIHKKMVKIERAQVKPSVTHIRKCYEDMVMTHGRNSVDVWLDFMHFEALFGQDPESCNMLIWRAEKTLQRELVEDFQSRITNLLTGDQIITDEDFATL